MRTFIEFALSTIGKSGAGHKKGLRPDSHSFGDMRGGARKPDSPISSQIKAGLKVPYAGLVLGQASKCNKRMDNWLGQAGEPKIKRSKLPSELQRRRK